MRGMISNFGTVPHVLGQLLPPVCKRENLERLYQSSDVIGDVVVCLCPLTQARTTLIAQLHEWGAEMCNRVSNYHVRLHHHVDQAFLIFLCTVKT